MAEYLHMLQHHGQLVAAPQGAALLEEGRHVLRMGEAAAAAAVRHRGSAGHGARVLASIVPQQLPRGSAARGSQGVDGGGEQRLEGAREDLPTGSSQQEAALRERTGRTASAM